MRSVHVLLSLSLFLPSTGEAKGAAWTGRSGYAMMKVEAGPFTMGSPSSELGRGTDEGQRETTIESAMYVGRTEVTQGLWRSVMGGNPSITAYKGLSLLGDKLPVQNVSWCEAVTFANALSTRDGLTPAYTGVEKCRTLGHAVVTWDRSSEGYRLPTEAEWEYAARAGEADDAYAGGVSEAEACRVGNVADESARTTFLDWKGFSCSDGEVGLAPVGRYGANPWGFRDMTGNVSEWCWDGEGVDSGGDPADGERVFRGGSWVNQPGHARVARRDLHPAGFRSYSLGFRLVRTLN